MADTPRLSDNALRQLLSLWQTVGKSWRPMRWVCLFFGPPFREPYLFLIPSTLVARIVEGWAAD
jgi:hypothetical protein